MKEAKHAARSIKKYPMCAKCMSYNMSHYHIGSMMLYVVCCAMSTVHAMKFSGTGRHLYLYV